MATETVEQNKLTAAAQQYLEQYGDPLVTNTYLKITILVLAVVCVGLITAMLKEQRIFAGFHPLVIRINDVGRAEAVDYNSFSYKPQEAENRYFLSRWAELYYGRNHSTLRRDFTQSLYFLNGDIQNAVIDQDKKTKIIDNFLTNSTAPNVDIEVHNVAIEDLRQAPYKARIEFTKIFYSVPDHQEMRREQWTANVVYRFRNQVASDMLPINPLGLTIIYFREDQAFKE